MEITGKTWFGRFRKSVHLVSGWAEWVGLVALMGMVLTALVDVVGSKWFHWPLPGSTEIISVLQMLAIASGLAFSKIVGRHIRIDMFVDRLKGRGKAALEIFNSILGLGLFVVAGWMTYEYGLSLFGSGTGTFLLGITYYPFVLWISFCCIPVCCVLIIELLSFIDKVLK
jgi:TRAP-type C4-dicarboxylate transport system permease small subunit